MTAAVAIGVDLGGTNLKAAVVDRKGAVVAALSVPTAPSRGPEAVVQHLADIIDELLKRGPWERAQVAGVGIGTPGPLNIGEGRIIRAANLPGWLDVPLREMVETATLMRVIVENDANAAAYGEFLAGRSGDGGDLVMFTLGTGVGGGVIIDGRILHGHFDNAGELGHMIVEPDGWPCACGQRGCLECYASASALVCRASDAVLEGEGGAIAKSVRGGREVSAKEVVEAAMAGDAVCRRVWEDACRYLAIACVNVQHAFNPARVVFGGGLAETGEVLIEDVGRHLKSMRWALHEDLPRLELATLGYDAGVIGAGCLAWS